MSGFDPRVTSEAFSDPGTIMSLLGTIMPNITRGMPSQGYGYTLKPGQVLQHAGEMYSTIKGRQEVGRELDKYAKQTQTGAQFAPYGGTDPEAYAYSGTPAPSPAEQGINLAGYQLPTFGQTFSGMGPEARKAILSGARGGSEIERVLGLGQGQTPFERLFDKIQGGELYSLQHQKDQTRARLSSDLAKDPFNPQLRQAVMALSPPGELTALAKDWQEKQGRVRYLSDRGIHSELNVLSPAEAQATEAAGLGVQRALQLQALEAQKIEADKQIKVLEDSQMGAAAKQTLIRMLRIKGTPIPDLEKWLVEGQKDQQITALVAKSPLANTLMSQQAPLNPEEMNKVLALPEVSGDPELQKILIDLNRSKWASYEQTLTRRARTDEFAKSHAMAALTRSDQNFQTNLSRANAQAGEFMKREAEFKASTEGAQILQKANGDQKKYYELLQQNPAYRNIDKGYRDAIGAKRTADVQHRIETDPESLVSFDAYDMPQELRSIASDKKIPAEVRMKQIQDKMNQLPGLQKEYGHKVDEIMAKQKKPGWSETVIPEVRKTGTELLNALGAEQSQAPQPTLVPPTTPESFGQGVGEAVRGAATLPLRTGIRAGQAIKQVPGAVKGFGRGVTKGLTPPEPVPSFEP